METLKFNVLGSDGKQSFITPRVTITALDPATKKKVTKLAPESLWLDLGYIAMVVCNGEGNYLDVTKLEAGKLIYPLVSALPKDAIISVYMPTLDTDRKNSDLAKWTMALSVNASEYVKACEWLGTIYARWEQAKVVTYTGTSVKQPVYNDGSKGAAKVLGGKKSVTSLF